jgi:hypothetical protein
MGWDFVMTPMTYVEFKDAARLHLPQFNFISDKNMRAWYESALTGNQPIEWYLYRLNSVGGSEGGIIVAHHLGVDNVFNNTMESLYRSKMMLDPLAAPTEAMSFGIKREEEVRSAFEEMAFKVGWVRATAVLARFEDRAKSGQAVGGLGYSPDDAFIKPGGQLCMVDYKTPYRKVPSAEKIPIGYVSQLHQGAYIAKNELGLPADSPLIVDGVDRLLVYGIHPESNCANRADELYLLSFDIPHNQVIEDIIATKVKSFFSDYVLVGKSPTIVQDDIDFMAAKADELVGYRRLMVQLEAQLNAAKIEAEKQLKPIKDKIAEIESNISGVTNDLTSVYLRSDSRADVNAALKNAGAVASASVTHALNVDIERIQAYGAQNKVDVDGYITLKSTGKIDTERLVEAFLALKPDSNMDDFEIKKPQVDVNAMIQSGDFPADFFSKSVTWKVPKAELMLKDEKEPENSSANPHEYLLRP